MKIGYDQSLQQTQKLIVTPELRQALEILQIPLVELQALVNQELLQNPILEIKDEADGEAQTSTEGDSDDSAGQEIDWADYFHDGSDFGVPRERPSESLPGPDHFGGEIQTLSEHLLSQLRLAGLSQGEQRIGQYLIGLMDHNGFLIGGLDEAAASLKVGFGDVLRVLWVIQGFDPLGVGARDLRECLLIQWNALGADNQLVPRIISDHLEDLASGKFSRVAEALGVTLGEVQRAVDLIRRLDPKPGRRFGTPDDIHYVVPDVLVERVGPDYVVIVNDSLVPRLGINLHYRKMLAGSEGEAKKFLEGKLNSALWFIKSLEQRRLTLTKVVESIVERQRAFFDRGLKFLKPMTLKEVANEVGIHESTVSRAISKKFVQTPRGVFDLKFFFASGVENQAGEGVSSESVKRLMREAMEKEDPFNPLSDQALTGWLEQQGMKISRRTVTKYREELVVPSSTKRKRFR